MGGEFRSQAGPEKRKQRQRWECTRQCQALLGSTNLIILNFSLNLPQQ